MNEPAATPISVSMVLPVADGWERTFRCLLALVRACGGVRRETIVIDNGTSDDTRAALPKLDGLRLIRNEREVGFGKACNQALELAQGDVFLVVDRDAVMEPGWLLPILRPFEDPAVAAVVPGAGSGLEGAFLALRTQELRAAGGWEEARPDAADALLQGFLSRGRRVEQVAVPQLQLAATPSASAPAPAPAARPPLSVVIPVRDAAATLSRCLESLARCLGPDDEVVIADGGSQDQTLRSAYEYAARNPRAVRVLTTRGPGGLPAAARTGLEAASRETLVLLQATVAAPDGFLDGLLQLLAQNPGTQALGIEVPRAGLCVAGPSALLRSVDAASFFQADGVALAEAMGRAGARLAYVPAGG